MRNDPLVKPKFEREADNAPGPFYVAKDQCIICGLPPDVAPQNITWDAQFRGAGCTGCPNHCRVERQPETAEEIARVVEAACYSCVEAIRYCGTDPKIIDQFRKAGKENLCDAI